MYQREEGVDRGVWDEFCSTNVDLLLYAGLPLNEVVFWFGDGGRVGSVELTGWRVEMRRNEEKNEDEEVEEHLVVQE